MKQTWRLWRVPLILPNLREPVPPLLHRPRHASGRTICPRVDTALELERLLGQQHRQTFARVHPVSKLVPNHRYTRLPRCCINTLPCWTTRSVAQRCPRQGLVHPRTFPLRPAHKGHFDPERASTCSTFPSSGASREHNHCIDH